MIGKTVVVSIMVDYYIEKDEWCHLAAGLKGTNYYDPHTGQPNLVFYIYSHVMHKNMKYSICKYLYEETTELVIGDDDVRMAVAGGSETY
jgi:hypothetical protein